MNDTTRAEVLAQIDPELLRAIGDVQDMWASSPEIAWRVRGNDPKGRSDVYVALDLLADAGVLKTITLVHNKRPMRAYRCDPRSIRSLLAQAA